MDAREVLCVEVQREDRFGTEALDRYGIIPAIRAQGWNPTITQDDTDLHALLGRHRFNIGVAVLEHPEPERGLYERLGTISCLDTDVEWIALLSSAAMRKGPLRRIVASHFFDYHTLPPNLAHLLATMGHAYGMAEIVHSRSSGNDTDTLTASQTEMIGTGPAMRKLFSDIRKMARVDAPILITGESGTGKELAAQAVHERSLRAAGPFVAVNCGSVPASLVQSELFGYEKGAFTGAQRRKIGHIETASGGTLFLDEIGDLPLELQANLLRFLQQGTIQRVGGSAEIEVNARVVAATHVDLEQAVAKGRIREDLYFRLNVLRLETPPLRERPEDIELIARFFYDRFVREYNRKVKGFSQEALQCMVGYPWPGNVRELINQIRRALVMCDKRLISPSDLGLARSVVPTALLPLAQARAQAERKALKTALEHSGQNLSRAAQILQVSRPALYRLIAKHKLRADMP